MDYEKKYKEALEKARQLCAYPTTKSFISDLQDLFPELAESKDERIRKEIIAFIKKRDKSGCDYDYDQWIAWIEKQGEQKVSYTTIVETGDGGINALVTRELPTDGCDDGQKPADKVEPKFKVGDWVIDKQGIVHQIANVVENVTNHTYGYDIVGGGYFNDNVEDVRLWTIQDAKDGDVLAYVTDEEDLWIMIYWSLYEPYEGHVHYHALLVNDKFSDKGTCCICINDLKPATKEQRDLLFQKMHKAGYEWDAEERELKLLITNGGDFELENCIQNPAWSEEDKNFMYDTLSNLTELKDRYGEGYGNVGKCIDWLKSLKERIQPQSRWKPSDEQIKVCKEVYADLLSAKGFDLGTVFSELNRLEEGLKKKGE